MPSYHDVYVTTPLKWPMMIDVGGVVICDNMSTP